MNQSDRIKFVKEYCSNPLRKKYEKEKEQICKNKPKKYYAFKALMAFPWLMIVVYLVLFVMDQEGSESYSGIIILLGLANLPIAPFLTIWYYDKPRKVTEEYNSREISRLNRKYMDDGLYPMPESELYKHACCEYDDWKEDWVCSATKEHLPFSEVSWCKTSGNCRHCKRFVTNYLGPNAIKYWGYEFEK